MRSNKSVYSLKVSDIQSVALESFGRKLTGDEINQLIDPISEAIPWFEVIEDAIEAKLHIQTQSFTA